MFDAPSVQNGRPLAQARNFLDAYRDAYGLTDGELSAAIVIHGTALPLAFDDATWARFRFGERFAIRDAQVQAPRRHSPASGAHYGL